MKNIKCFDLLLEPVNTDRASVSSKKVKNASTVVKIVNDIYHLNKSNREKSIVVGLNANGVIMGMHEVSSGQVCSTSVLPEEIFKFLLLTNSSHFVVLHNHPSGNSTSSKEDQACTARLLKCAKLMNVVMVDHIIIARDDFCSLRAETAIFDLA